MNNFCKKCGTKNSGNNFCTKCGHQFSFQPQTNFQHQINKRSNAWYLLPIVFGLTTVIFGIVGGIIAYFVLKNSDPKKAKNCLIIGIIFAILGLLLIYLGFFNSLDFSLHLIMMCLMLFQILKNLLDRHNYNNVKITWDIYNHMNWDK